MGGQIVPRKAIFAKGKYYVEIAAEPEGDHTAALQELDGGAREDRSGSTRAPAALSWFPEASSSRCAWCRKACSEFAS